MIIKKNINVVKLFDLTPNSFNYNKWRCMTQRREYRYVNLEIEIERVFVLIRRPTPCLPPPPPPQKKKSNFTNPADCKALNGSMINLLHWKLICLLFCFRRFFPRHTRWYPSWWKKANGLENLSNGLQGRLFRQVIIYMINNFHYWKIHSTQPVFLHFLKHSL